eukprot:COSAG02_NODE_345_length_24135_cov_6.425404_6_plen_106_part_00
MRSNSESKRRTRVGVGGAYREIPLTAAQPTGPACQRNSCKSPSQSWLQFANAIEFGKNNCGNIVYYIIQRCFDQIVGFVLKASIRTAGGLGRTRLDELYRDSVSF